MFTVVKTGSLFMFIIGFAMWDAGCIQFIHGYVIPDLLETKIESPIHIKPVQTTRENK